MRLIIVFLFALFFLSNCTKPRTVLICGDHICINKSEANQYFEENLSLEVKLIDKKELPKIDLIELNLKQNDAGDKSISVYSKEKTKKEVRALSRFEVNEIKNNIKKMKNNNKITKKKTKVKNKKKIFKNANEKKIITKNNKVAYKDVNKKAIKNLDVCAIIENCTIDEISKYLLKQGKKNKFPDITTRQ
ncbi:hypothetical protein OAL89_01800 [Pelagibacteraceae bacterium]|jgi:hypothetical protein|nr:hypothetical protein [Pelagibacteraceae bacterium]